MPVVEIHGQYVSASAKGQRVAADPRAQIDDKGALESGGLVASDGLGRRLLEPDRVEPHPIAAGEFPCGPGPAGGQPDGRGDVAAASASFRHRAMSAGRGAGTAATSARSSWPSARREHPGLGSSRAELELASSRQALRRI